MVTLRVTAVQESPTSRDPRSPGAARALQEAWTGQALPEADLGALAAEIARRGLVRRDNACSSRHTGVSWHKASKKWEARLGHGGKQERLGLFATEAEAKARYDARRLELGVDPHAGTSSGFCGVRWSKASRKWQSQITVDGEVKALSRRTSPRRATSAASAPRSAPGSA